MATYYLEGERTKQFPLLTEPLRDELFAQVEQQAIWSGDAKALHEALVQLLWVANDAETISLEYVFYSTQFGKHRLFSTDRYRMMSVTFGESDSYGYFVALHRGELKSVVTIVKSSQRAGFAYMYDQFAWFGTLKSGQRWVVVMPVASSTMNAIEEFAQMYKEPHVMIARGTDLATLAKDGMKETERVLQGTKQKVVPRMVFIETSVQFPKLSDKLFTIPGAELLKPHDPIPANPEYFEKLPNAPVAIQFPSIEKHEFGYLFVSGAISLRWNYLDLPYTYIVMPMGVS